MDSLVVRVVLVVAVVGLALLAGWVANRWQQPVHPPIDIAGLDLAPGVVAFTSTQCDNCKRVMAMLGTIDVPVREVTNELEGAMLAAANVEAVPLIAVTDRDGVLVRQLAGAPSKVRLRRAIRAGGW